MLSGLFYMQSKRREMLMALKIICLTSQTARLIVIISAVMTLGAGAACAALTRLHGGYY